MSMKDQTIPKLGLGTYGRTGDEGIAALLKAIEIGYRHLDTAQSYGTEQSVGEAMRRSNLQRDDFFVTTKVADTKLDKMDFMPSVRASLDTIGVDQVDLLLIHWPSHRDAVPFEDYMLALAEARQKGYTRLIGVSNYPAALLDRSEALIGKGALATNQVEVHPYLQARKLVAHARQMDLPLTAYQPLAKGEISGDPVLERIAENHGVTAAAVALAFLMAEGHIVIPASGSEVNLKANFAAGTVLLDKAEMDEIRTLDRGHRRINPEKSPRWDD
jgi:2,5-diketo-D-gluconate reductase B